VAVLVQLYWSTDEALVDSMIGRAEQCGAGALVVTLDTTILGWRPQDLNLGSLPFVRGHGLAQYTSDPRFIQIVRDRLGSATSRPKAQLSLGALRTLASISREYPGSFRGNLRSAEPRAADVLIALALGANACLIGRPYVYGLAIGGADGVRQVIENIVAELDLTMGLLGVQTIQDLSRDLLAKTQRARLANLIAGR
jgi:isopentenyl diphosphate isomerase/L-lactate dehydrogenase-like FMN-dependent dehydrogenase